MQTTAQRWLHIEAGEGHLVAVLALLLFGNTMAIQVSSVVAVSGILAEEGPLHLLGVLLVDMLVVIVVTAAQSLVIDRVNRVTLLGGLAALFGVLFVALRLMIAAGMPAWLNYGLLYILSEQQLLFFPLLFWSLAGDIYDPAQARRLYPTINSLRFLGRLLGLAVVAVFAHVGPSLGLNTHALLVFNGAFYLLAFALIRWRLAPLRLRPRASGRAGVRETLAAGFEFIRDVPAFRYLMVAIFLVCATDIIVEFRFLTVTDQAFVGAASYEAFYSVYRIGVALASFAVAGLLVTRLLQRLELKNAFFALPATLLGASLLMLASAGLPAAVAAMAAMQVVRDTLHDSARESFLTLVPNERRGRVSVFAGSYVLAGGTIVGVLFTGAAVLLSAPGAPVPARVLYLGFVVAASLGAIVAVARMRRVYDSSLFNWRLKRRQRANSVLNRLDL